MAYFYKTYNLVKDYAKLHNLILVNGFYSNSDKQDDYIDIKKFSLEINKSGFVTLRYKEDFYIVICKKQLFKDTASFNKMDNICKNRKEMLIIYEYELDQKKLQIYLEENKPIVNAIPLQSFLFKLDHKSLPKKIELFDFEKENSMLMISKKSLPEISFNDPVIAWLRLKPGQVIKIKDYCPTSGYYITYRQIL